MQINIDPDSSYLFRPGNLRELEEILNETLAEAGLPKSRDMVHQRRLYKILDLIEALQRATREASR
jgi:hypothetical protein